jgi:hypothetical protein
MQDAALTLSNTPTISTSLRAKALNIFESPGEVFDEIASGPAEFPPTGACRRCSSV